ncbi:hypothetical protein [Polymorphospora rubra]|nr:hypothetical protein [Polymorphospora rubra]
MRTPGADEALRWLAGQGVIPLGRDRWLAHGRECTTDDVAHQWSSDAVNDDLPPAELLRRGFGLLDLLDHYCVTVEIGFLIANETDPAIRAVFWAGYRERLEREEPVKPVLYSLWVDWFEDHTTSDEAFRAVLADDTRYLRSRNRLDDLATGPLHRRAARVLEHSGPVSWLSKHDVYRAAATVPALHRSVYRGLLTSYHDFYGDLDPAAARTLLDQLDLPPDTEHLPQLRAVLLTGARNHYLNPDLWKSVAST